MKTVFIIPGLGETEENNPVYQKIARYFKEKKIRPFIVPIHWQYRTMSDYVIEFTGFYNKYKTEESIFLGFSFGAFIAFLAAIELKPKAIILCSLSPYFKEDINGTIDAVRQDRIDRFIGKRRIKDFKQYSFGNLAEKINSKTYILYGGKELSVCQKRAIDAGKKIKNSQLIKINNTEHNIRQEGYQKELQEMISKEF
ncbi:alpha/beta hydrolase [candidate division WS5 bacterium]|uniref:Alpha/beta hydrolase n=1 Tax=candidate division WS5 bacterium TaxID=2093353 RepID=A0A419DEF9_9BACT|nr:MAG: alpha/beta hydrolase [candidate division WS5 bacterium]